MIHRILVVSLLQNNELAFFIIGKQPHYKLDKTLFTLLYKVPLYDFQPVQPLFLIYWKEKQNFEYYYLLIYNSGNSAVKSLIFITQVDTEQYIFQWLVNGKFAYYYNNKIIIESSFTKIFDIKQNNLFDCGFTYSQAKLIVFSAISNESKTIVLNYEYFNIDENLRFKLNVKKEQQHLSLVNNILIGLEKIFGPVEVIELSSNCKNAQIQVPLQITHTGIYCTIFINKICFQSNQTLYDPFGKELKFNYIQLDNVLYAQVIQVFLLVYSFENFDTIVVQVYGQYSNLYKTVSKIQIQQKLFFNQIFQLSYSFRKTNQILYSEINCVMIVLQMNINYEFNLQAEYDFSFANYQKIIFLDYLSNQNIQVYMQILVVNQNQLQIYFINFEKENITFSKVQILNLVQVIYKFEIIEIRLAGQKLKIDLIIHTDDNDQCKNQFLTFQYEVFYDFNKKYISSERLVQYFRYFDLIEKVFVFNNSLIGIVTQEKKIKFFPIIKDIQTNFSDFFYQYHNENVFQIQQYNDSYILLIDINTFTYRLAFINYYQIHLSHQKTCDLILQNKISSIKVKVKVMKISNNANLLYYLLNILNFIFILILIAKEKYSRKVLREQKKKIIADK